MEIACGLAVALETVAAPATALAWGVSYWQSPKPVHKAPDQSWLQDVPERRGRGKVAVFALQGGDAYQPVREAVVKLLRRRGLNVTASLRPVDSASQYRELFQTLNLAVYIDGEVTGEGDHQTAVIRLRSGVSGERIASAVHRSDEEDRRRPAPQALDAGWPEGQARVRRGLQAARAGA